MKWSEDGTTVSLTSEEFAAHTKSMADMKIRTVVEIKTREASEKMLRDLAHKDDLLLRNAALIEQVNRLLSDRAKFFSEFTSLVHDAFTYLQSDVHYRRSDLETLMNKMRTRPLADGVMNMERKTNDNKL